MRSLGAALLGSSTNDPLPCTGILVVYAPSSGLKTQRLTRPGCHSCHRYTVQDRGFGMARRRCIRGSRARGEGWRSLLWVRVNQVAVGDRRGQHTSNKVAIPPVSASFLVFSTRLRIVYARPLKAKQSDTYRLELVRRTRLVVKLCAHAAAPKKSQKRQTTCCPADERLRRRRREPKHRAPRSPREESVYEYRISRSMQRGREWYHAIAGPNVEANPAIRLQCPRKIDQREQ